MAEPHGRRGRKFATGDSDAETVDSAVEQVTEEESVSEPTVSQEPEPMGDEDPEVDTQADGDEDGE